MRITPNEVSHQRILRGSFFLETDVGALLEKIYGVKRSLSSLETEKGPLPYFTNSRIHRRSVTLGPFNMYPTISPEFGGEVLEELVSIAKGKGNFGVHAKLHFPVSNELQSALSLTFASSTVETLLSLEGGIDAVLSSMRSRQRTKLRSQLKLKSTGAVRIELISPDNPNHVYSLFSETYLRKHRTLPPPKELLSKLHLLELENSEVIHIGAFEGSSKKPSAVLIMLLDQTQLLYAWGTSGSDSGPEMSTLLIHEAINIGLQRGARVLNLGVSPLSHIGLRQFKRGWGGLEVPIYDYFWNMRAGILDPHDDFRILKPMISKIPPWSAPALSRLAVRYFV